MDRWCSSSVARCSISNAAELVARLDGPDLKWRCFSPESLSADTMTWLSNSGAASSRYCTRNAELGHVRSTCLSALGLYEPPLRRLETLYQTSGLLVHVSPDWSLGGFLERAQGTTSLATFPLQNDCGKWCSAFTLLTPDLPMTIFGSARSQDSGVGLLYEPTPKVWQHVQCASVTDSNMCVLQVRTAHAVHAMRATTARWGAWTA